MKSVGRLEERGANSSITWQRVVGGRDGGAIIVNYGIYNEHLVQIVSVTSQVAISNLVHKYKLASSDLRDEGREG